MLHGLTMSGRSMLRALGPLKSELESAGFGLIAPDAPHRLTPEELLGIARWARARFGEDGANATELPGASGHFDWLCSDENPNTRRKHYFGLDASLHQLAQVTRAHRIVGLLGFSQGAALAVILTALAAQGDSRFSLPRFAIFFSGFKPVFHSPIQIRYPIGGSFRKLSVMGGNDPLSSGAGAALAPLVEAFEEGEHEQIVVPGLKHELPRTPDVIRRVTDFAIAAAC